MAKKDNGNEGQPAAERWTFFEKKMSASKKCEEKK